MILKCAILYVGSKLNEYVYILRHPCRVPYFRYVEATLCKRKRKRQRKREKGNGKRNNEREWEWEWRAGRGKGGDVAVPRFIRCAAVLGGASSS